VPQPTLVTLTTDFGLDDHFVGTMKGVMLNINPSIQFVDICHGVRSFDLLDGALTLALSYTYFPPETIHLVVVDPGVGSARRPILAACARGKFVAPDNGVLSLVYQRETNLEVRHATAERYFLHPVSNTFHGRDIFAPLAGWLSNGTSVEQFGGVITDYVTLNFPKPERVAERQIQGVVLKVDKFGNLITNFAPDDVPELFSGDLPPFRITVQEHKITRMYTSYSMGKASELFTILGSSGYLEVCRNLGSAAGALEATRGTRVSLEIGKTKDALDS
jgi:S-adenosyl-L-methionine hydrolase (adenosine-forming)